MTEPEWLKVGAQVAIHGGGRRDTVKLDEIARLTPRDVVLAGGQRFRRSALYKSGASAWSGGTYLRSADDPIVVRALEWQREGAIRSRARAAVEPLLVKFFRDGDLVAGREAVHALSAALDALDVDGSIHTFPSVPVRGYSE